MNGFDEDLSASVTSSASFGVSDVADRVARRRGRRAAGGAAAVVALVVGLGAGAFWVLGDDEPDLEAVDDLPTTTVATTSLPPDPSGELRPVVEDPVGADGVSGPLSDLHVETTETFGFVECGANGEPGPPAAERAMELDAVIETLRSGGLHDQPFVTSSGGPQSIWGVLSIGLSSNYEPTLRWIADRVDPADVCIEFAEFGIRNIPPALAPVVVDRAATGDELAVTAEGCAPKGEWVAPFIREIDGRAEAGIAVGRGQLRFTDDCPSPVTQFFSHTPGLVAGAATEPGTLAFPGPVAPGSTSTFSFDERNVARTSTSIGDDLIAQLSTDRTVQFQVSDVFAGEPVAGAVGEIALDQWPVTGDGTLVVPAGVPAGTYHVRFIASPELNGILEVTGDDANGLSGGPDLSLEPVVPGVSVSDVHVEATDMVFPDCPATLDPTATTPERSAELEALRVRLNTDGLTDPAMFYSGSSINGGRLQIGLYRRYQPTIDFLAERAEPDDICWFLLPPVGAFTGVPGSLEWIVDETTVDGPDDTDFAVVNAAQCGVIYKDLLLPPQVIESDNRIEIAVPLLPRFGPSILPCLEPDRFEITLSAPVGDRDIVPLVGPTVTVIGQLDSVGTVPGEQVTVAFDPAGLGGASTMGDDMMLQSVDDPSVQIQIGSVFTDSPAAGEPAPIVTDRWEATGQANLLVPTGTPPGAYTFMFIEHPQFWGTLTVS